MSFELSRPLAARTISFIWSWRDIYGQPLWPYDLCIPMKYTIKTTKTIWPGDTSRVALYHFVRENRVGNHSRIHLCQKCWTSSCTWRKHWIRSQCYFTVWISRPIGIVQILSLLVLDLFDRMSSVKLYTMVYTGVLYRIHNWMYVEYRVFSSWFVFILFKQYPKWLQHSAEYCNWFMFQVLKKNNCCSSQLPTGWKCDKSRMYVINNGSCINHLHKGTPPPKQS